MGALLAVDDDPYIRELVEALFCAAPGSRPSAPGTDARACGCWGRRRSICTYCVDLGRAVVFAGSPEFDSVVLFPARTRYHHEL